MYGAGGLFMETGTELAATETAAGASAGAAGTVAAGTSVFGSLLGWVGVGLMAYNLISSNYAMRKQKEQQRALANQQIEQAKILREKIKADNAGLYSSVQSSIAQTSGAMGAVY